jgi:proline iminopeptidase
VKRVLLVAWLVAGSLACSGDVAEEGPVADGYLDYSGRADVLSGGARLIPIETAAGTFNVWTKRVGNHPTRKVLLLHGGPGATHEYLEAFDSYFPNAGIEYYYYDQLGSNFSDHPDDPSLWEVSRFVEEVEQVRRALGLGPENFYLYGQSWGGILAIEYALKYGDQLKGLIISNMMSSVPAYNAYANDVLKPAMDPAALAEIEAFEATEDFGNPRYVELLMEQHYVHHVLRMPLEDWPEPVNRSFSKINPDIYVLMQGPSELGLRGTLEAWDRSADLAKIETPTLVIGARYDTMDPAHMQWMAGQFPNGRYLYCENGSHLAPYDDQETYFRGLIEFIKDVDAGSTWRG